MQQKRCRKDTGDNFKKKNRFSCLISTTLDSPGPSRHLPLLFWSFHFFILDKPEEWRGGEKPRAEATQGSFSELQKSWGFDFSPRKGQGLGQILFYIKWLTMFCNNLVVSIAVLLLLASLWGEMLKLIFSKKKDSTICHNYQNRDFLGKEWPFAKLIVMYGKKKFVYVLNMRRWASMYLCQAYVCVKNLCQTEKLK